MSGISLTLSTEPYMPGKGEAAPREYARSTSPMVQRCEHVDGRGRCRREGITYVYALGNVRLACERHR